MGRSMRRSWRDRPSQLQVELRPPPQRGQRPHQRAGRRRWARPMRQSLRAARTNSDRNCARRHTAGSMLTGKPAGGAGQGR
eukprot:9735143-Alexandrium_andersonii.AAC.1